MATKLAHHSKQVGKCFNPDTIHKLRTLFKKFRALLRWQAAGKKVYSDFKKVYNQAGAIRNLQVAQQILKEDTLTSAAFNAWLTARLTRLEKEWGCTDHKRPLKQLLEGISNLEIICSKHNNFFEKKMKKIQQIINDAVVTDNSIHDCRKAMKDIQYVCAYCEKKNASSRSIKKIPVQQIKAITEQVGAFNDQCLLINLLENFTVGKTLSLTQANMLDIWGKKRYATRKALISSIRHLKRYRSNNAQL